MDSSFIPCDKTNKKCAFAGVRPFKCAESSCSAAFTTKQCLQFHYKKVHQYVQEQIPKIERSVAYTFDAYSGGLQLENEGWYRHSSNLDKTNRCVLIYLADENGQNRLQSKGSTPPSTYDYRNESESSNDAFAVFRNFSSKSRKNIESFS